MEKLDFGFSREGLQNAMNVYGTEVISHLRRDDRPGLFAPLIFNLDGKIRTGGVLTVGDRAIFVWEQGRFRAKQAAEIVPFGDVSAVKCRSQQTVKDFDRPLDTLEFSAAKRWNIAVPASAGIKPKLIPHLAGILEG